MIHLTRADRDPTRLPRGRAPGVLRQPATTRARAVDGRGLRRLQARWLMGTARPVLDRTRAGGLRVGRGRDDWWRLDQLRRLLPRRLLPRNRVHHGGPHGDGRRRVLLRHALLGGPIPPWLRDRRPPAAPSPVTDRCEPRAGVRDISRPVGPSVARRTAVSSWMSAPHSRGEVDEDARDDTRHLHVRSRSLAIGRGTRHALVEAGGDSAEPLLVSVTNPAPEEVPIGMPARRGPWSERRSTSIAIPQGRRPRTPRRRAADRPNAGASSSYVHESHRVRRGQLRSSGSDDLRAPRLRVTRVGREPTADLLAHQKASGSSLREGEALGAARRCEQRGDARDVVVLPGPASRSKGRRHHHSDPLQGARRRRSR